MVSQYVPRLGQPPTAWDDQAFASVGDVLYGNVSTARWLSLYLHLAADVYVPTAAAINAALAADTTATLLGPYTATSPNYEAV